MSSSTEYRSTRGACRGLSFEDVVLGGLAPDRGLYVPEAIPAVPMEEIESWRSLSFPDLAHRIMSKYVSEAEIPAADLADICRRSVLNFRSPDVTPLVRVGDSWVLELFHGPTFAFKDVALQFLGNLFEYFITRRRDRGEDASLTILGATSGDTVRLKPLMPSCEYRPPHDTSLADLVDIIRGVSMLKDGSAAIYGLRGKKNVDCFIMFPKGRVSQIQERQMTTVPDSNIHCLSVKGSFDDCQDIVKAAFADKPFRDDVKLGAVNSINWARVLAQMTYYFWAYFRVTETEGTVGIDGDSRRRLHFSVPTGNFGDILAGYYARKMGLPVGRLLVATNENDILHRFFTTGRYWRESVMATVAPSMDICVSSNFERFLFHLAGDDAVMLKSWMDRFEKTGKLTLEGDILARAKDAFSSARVPTEENLGHICQSWERHGYLFCPHSAVGAAAPARAGLPAADTVALATAHPAKFPDAVRKVVDPLPPAPEAMAALWTLPTRSTPLPNDLSKVEAFIYHTLGKAPAAASAALRLDCEKKTKQRRSLILVGVSAMTVAVAAVFMLISKQRHTSSRR